VLAEGVGSNPPTGPFLTSYDNDDVIMIILLFFTKTTKDSRGSKPGLRSKSEILFEIAAKVTFYDLTYMYHHSVSAINLSILLAIS
jgi:hypothetical protein